jgi:DNA-directed RNA polymerase specialized sigma subunit
MEGPMRLAADHYVYANPFLEPVSLDALAGASGEDGDATAIPDPGVDIEGEFERIEAEAMIGRFVETLGDRDRAIVEAIFWNGTSQADVARAFKVSGAAISKRLDRIAARGQAALACLRDSALLQ